MSPGPVEELVSSPWPAALSEGASYKSKETISKKELLVWVQECKARPLWSSDRSLSHHRITAGVPEFHLSKLSGLVLPGLPYHLAPIPLLLLISKTGAQDCPLSSARRVSLAPGHTPASSSKALSRCNPCKWPWGLKCPDFPHWPPLLEGEAVQRTSAGGCHLTFWFASFISSFFNCSFTSLFSERCL